MRSIAWPVMFPNKTTTGVKYDLEATEQNLMALLLTEKRDLFGDPYFGMGFKKFMHDQNDTVMAALLADAVYSTVCRFMPQLVLDRRDIMIGSTGSSVVIYFYAKNKIDFTTNLYNIVLTDTMI